MKKTKRFLPMTLLFMLLLQVGFTQASLEIVDCEKLKVSFNYPGNQKGINHEFLLEKELIEGVWQKVTIEKRKSTEHVFDNLLIGTYRVSVIPEVEGRTKTKLHFKGKNQSLRKATVFVSNKIVLTGEESPCNEEAKQRLLKRSNNSSVSILNQVDLFPNPANTHLTVRIPTVLNLNQAELTIQDISGREIMKKTMSSNIEQLSIAHLEEGVYFLKIRMTEHEVVYKKMLILR